MMKTNVKTQVKAKAMDSKEIMAKAFEGLMLTATMLLVCA